MKKEKVEQKKPRKEKISFKEEMSIDVYDLARQGYSNAQIAKTLGISVQTLVNWVHTRPTIKYSLEKARQLLKESTEQSFSTYIYNQLSPHLKLIWDEIMRCHEQENGVIRLEALFAEQGKKVRQQMFIHAWITYGFNASEALKIVNVSRNVLQGWIARDPEFAELVDEIHWHKGNFFEAALIDLVKRGDSSAVIFANKTYNRNRGYSDKVEVEMKDGVPKTQINVQINGQSDLSRLSMEELLQLREMQRKIRQEHQEEQKLLTVEPKVIDVPVEEIKNDSVV